MKKLFNLGLGTKLILVAMFFACPLVSPSHAAPSSGPAVIASMSASPQLDTSPGAVAMNTSGSYLDIKGASAISDHSIIGVIGLGHKVVQCDSASPGKMTVASSWYLGSGIVQQAYIGGNSKYASTMKSGGFSSLSTMSLEQRSYVLLYRQGRTCALG